MIGVSSRIRHRGVHNILMTCSDDVGNGGVQVVFRDLIRSLERAGRHVHLLYQGPTTYFWLHQKTNSWGRLASYCPLPTLAKGSLFLSVLVALVYVPLSFFHLTRLIRRHKIDVINCHYLAEYFVHLALAARLLRLPLVVSVHGADVDRYERVRPIQKLLLRLVMRGADRIVGCSEAMADQTARVFPGVRAKITHVHNGLILDDLPPARPAGPRTPFVLSVSRQVPKKGIDTLVRAFARLNRDMPLVTLVIVGDGPELEKHRALASELGIRDSMTFLGDRDREEVLPLISSCSLFVLPSRAEPFGLVLLEAAYYRRPIVCTAVGGVPEIITDNVSGFVVPPDDPVAMAAKMAMLLSDPRLGDGFGIRAHDTLVARFRWEDRVRDYLAIYEGNHRPHATVADPDGSSTSSRGCQTAPGAPAPDMFRS